MAFSAVNGVFIVAAAGLVYLLTRRMAGPYVGIIGGWVFTLSLPVVENALTLGKQEPKQLVFWLLSLALLSELSSCPDWWNRRGLLAALAIAGTALFKETRLLLAGPTRPPVTGLSSGLASRPMGRTLS